MPSALRPNSLLDRFLKAGQVLLGREERANSGLAPAPFIAAYAGLAGIQHPFKPLESLDYYGDNPWLYAGVSLVAQEASRVKLKLYKPVKNGEPEEIEDHQAIATLNHPMPMDGGRTILTHMQLKRLLFSHMMLNGEGFLLLDGRMGGKYGNAPTIVHPLLPAFVIEKLDENYQIDKYFYRAAGNQLELDPLDVVHFKDPDPKMWYRGNSPVKAMRFSLDSHREADILNYKRLVNGAVPGGLLKPKSKMGAEETKRFQEQWNQQMGGGRNNNRTVVLPTDMDYARIQDTNAEMQYAELKSLSRDEILAALRIPIEMLGHTESQTRANAEVSNYVFQRFTILPRIEDFVDTLNNDYLPAFPGTEGMFFGFDDFVPEDMDNKRQTVQTLSDLGAMTPNEARAGFNLPPLGSDAADTTYMNFNKTPLEKVNEPDEPELEEDVEGDPVDDEEEVEEEGSRKRRAPDDEGDDEEGDDGELPVHTNQFFDKDKATKSLAALTVPFLIQAFQRGIDLGNESAGSKVNPDDLFTVNVRNAIERKSLQMSAKAVDTTEEDLRKVLLDAQADKVGVRELARRIDDLYGESMGYRSLRIARTEITGSINDGAVQTYKDKGYEYKEWSTTMDGHERDSHGEADGQVVAIDDYFQLQGGQAMYPGDSNLPPGESINCRCIAQPADSPEDRQANLIKMFLRSHGSLETRFVKALKGEFARQRDQVLAKLGKKG